MLGDSTVGKSSIVTRFGKNSFDSDTTPTLGVEYMSKYVSAGENYMVDLWDTYKMFY